MAGVVSVVAIVGIVDALPCSVPPLSVVAIEAMVGIVDALPCSVPPLKLPSYA